MTAIDALLLGDDAFPFHDLDERAPEIDAALGEGVAVTPSTDRDRLLELDAFDVLVDYRTESDPTDDRLDALRSFVEDGGGYLGLHCAADLTSIHDGDGGIEPREEPHPALRAFLGGHFVSHPEQSEFGVEIAADHPVLEGVTEFRVFDEPYRLDHDRDAVTVLARMAHADDDLDETPVVWVREPGAGRLVYVSLGHTTEALEHDACRRLLRNGIEWAASSPS